LAEVGRLSTEWGWDSALFSLARAAAVTWAIVAHLSGHRRAALALLTAASLMRPEVWPFLIAYGVWRRRVHDGHAAATR